MSKCKSCGGSLKSHGISPVDEKMCFVCYLAKMNNKHIDKISDLEAKLAESEKKVSYLFDKNAEQLTLWNKTASELMIAQRQLAEKERHIKGLIEIYNKNKFDFAIEQLEKVKEFLFEQNIEITRLNKISDFIENQINLLKEGK